MSEIMTTNHVGALLQGSAGTSDTKQMLPPALQRAEGRYGRQARGLPVELAHMQGCRAGGARRAETHEWRRMERGEPVSETLVPSGRTIGAALLCAAIFSIRK